jgi:ferric-dicitrate binding protein FerR (iron transport regulator)
LNNHQNFEELFRKYLENQCGLEEAETVLAWLEADEYSQEQKELISRLLSSHPEVSKPVAEALQQRLQKSFKITLQKIEEKEKYGGKLRNLSWLRYAAAAVLLILIGSGIYLLFQGKTSTKEVAKDIPKKQIKKDLAPGGNKAILTLADGKQIVLDEAQNGNLAEHGNTKVIKLDGQLAYNETGNATEVIYNTITIPRGGQYQLVLADGSKIWLNAASSLRFPTSFPGKERRVELTGEGYFEIAKNAAQPFKVKISSASGEDGGEVEVLGTHFNIMAYSDEAAIKTTLLEGSVKITHHNKIAMLTPGQQAKLQDQSIKVVDDVDTEEVVAWKDGYFQFTTASLQQVMRQIARWYDVDISYEGKIPERKFGGKISRDNNASEVLKILELSKVRFRITDKKIIVTQ